MNWTVGKTKTCITGERWVSGQMQDTVQKCGVFTALRQVP